MSAADTAQESARRTVSRAMWVGLWVWPAFSALDVYMCFVAYPNARFPLFVLYRVLVEAVFVVVYRATRQRTADVKRLFFWTNITFGIAAIAISLMAIELGGIRSPYMHGTSIVALVRAALVPEPWRRSLKTYGRIGLAFPMVMTFGALLSPEYRAGADEEDDERGDLENSERKPEGGDEMLDDRSEGEGGDIGSAEVVRRHRGQSLLQVSQGWTHSSPNLRLCAPHNAYRSTASDLLKGARQRAFVLRLKEANCDEIP